MSATTVLSQVAVRLGRSGWSLGRDGFVGLVVAAGVPTAAVLWVVLQSPIALIAGPVASVVTWRSVLTAADRRHARRVADAMPGVALMLGSAVAVRSCVWWRPSWSWAAGWTMRWVGWPSACPIPTLRYW